MKATLTYHSIDDSRSAISVAPAAFSAHLAWLQSGRVRVLPLDQLAAPQDTAIDAVALTFDDGYVNVRGAIEQLLDRGLPVTVFVVSGRVGATNDWNGTPERGIPTLALMDWTDLERLVAKGLTVEAHSRSHARLTRVSETALDEELGGCQEELRARLGARSSHLAYPYGDVNDRVERRAGAYFRHAHTAEFRVMTSDDAALRRPRLDMYYFQQPGALESWGTPAFTRRVSWVALKRKARQIVGR